MNDIHFLVDLVFTKLALVYGRDFTSKWEGLDMQEVKNDWAYELKRFENRPDAIGYALRNLPAKPPNVLEFRVIVNRAPDPPVLRIEPSRPNPEAVKKALMAARAALTKMVQP